jgi:cytochrome c oxidase assembly protein subunit 15
MPEPPTRPGAHRLAVALRAATVALLLFGGLVTNTGAALAVPDWPTTFGYNMFLFPWSKMEGGIFYEHSHRLIGSVVGLLTLALAVWLWITESRRWVRWLGVLAGVLVSLQGALGGLRVLLLSEVVAVLHGSLAPVFFALTAGLALVTSREWAGLQTGAAPDPVLRRLALLAPAVLYAQIVFGALLTHRGQRLDAHLAGAALLSLLVPALVARVLVRHRSQPSLVRPALWLAWLFGFQLVLGLGAYVGRFTGLGLPAAAVSTVAIPVAHRLTGALLLALSVVMALRAWRLARAATRPAPLPRPSLLERMPA